MSQLATLTNLGRAAIAKSIKERELHLAWGLGDPSWENENLPSLLESTQLFEEVGRRTVSVISFAEPDTEGNIIIPVGVYPDGSLEKVRYRQSEEPTPFLYMRINFDYEDAANAVIRELGLFMDTEVEESLPDGQQYFTPDQIVNKGLLLAAQIMDPPINRSSSIEQSIQFVLPI